MNTEFEFNKVTREDIDNYLKTSHVFNNVKETIEKERVALASFDDERLGSSMEKLDVAVCRNGVWEVLDIEDKISGYNEVPLGYLLSGLDYDGVLIILRKMSNMILDKCKSSITHYRYHVLSDAYKEVEEDLSLYGVLAKNHIALSSPEAVSLQADGIRNLREREMVIEWVRKKEIELHG